MTRKKKTINFANHTIIIITFILFALALFTKGFTHDLLLEVAIFLVSVKLILGIYAIRIEANRIEDKVDTILEELKKNSK